MKKVLITGATGGIGAATARLFAEKGYFTYLHFNKNEEKAKALAAELGGAAIGADLACADQVAAMFEQLPTLDVLINCAGVEGHGLFTDISEQEWDRVFNINVKGTFLCCKAALPKMIAKKCGCIINMSSMWGIAGASCEVHYSASKAAVIGLTKALAKEVAPSGITVNCIAPGAVNTEMLSCLSKEDIGVLCEETPLGRIAAPREIAECALYLASAGFMTGQVISPNGGLVI